MTTPEKTGKVAKPKNEQKKTQGKSKLESSKVAAVTKNLSQDLQLIESHKIKHKANLLAKKPVQAGMPRKRQIVQPSNKLPQQLLASFTDNQT